MEFTVIFKAARDMSVLFGSSTPKQVGNYLLQCVREKFGKDVDIEGVHREVIAPVILSEHSITLTPEHASEIRLFAHTNVLHVELQGGFRPVSTIKFVPKYDTATGQVVKVTARKVVDDDMLLNIWLDKGAPEQLNLDPPLDIETYSVEDVEDVADFLGDECPSKIREYLQNLPEKREPVEPWDEELDLVGMSPVEKASLKRLRKTAAKATNSRRTIVLDEKLEKLYSKCESERDRTNYVGIKNALFSALKLGDDEPRNPDESTKSKLIKLIEWLTFLNK